MSENNTAFSVLKTLSESFSAKAKALPAEKEEVATRTMVCFNISGQKMVAAIEEVAEVLEQQSCTRLPRVKKWVRGVANVRGRLLPVVDFADFLGNRLRTPPKLQRIVVLDVGDLYVGLLVDQVYGMRHFRVDGYTTKTTGAPEVLADYIEGGFIQGDEHWLLMRPSKLEQDPVFMDAAA